MEIAGQLTGLDATERIRPLRAMGLCLAIAVAAVLLLWTENIALYTLVGLLGFCLGAPLFFAWIRQRVDWFELLHIFGLVYFVYFGLGAVWVVHDPEHVAYDRYIVPYIPRSVAYCLVGYLALLAGYYVGWQRNASRKPEEWPRGALFIVLCSGLGLTGYMSQSLVEHLVLTHRAVPVIQGALSQLSPLFLFSWALGWLLYFSGRATRLQLRALALVLVPGALLVAQWTFSDKSLIMTIIGVPIIARWYARHRIPWMFLLVLLLVLMFAVFPLYNAFRWADPSMDQGTRLRTTVETMRGWSTDRYLLFSLGTFKRRLAMINSVAVVVRDTGRWVEYANGSTIFLPTLQFFVPRVLWPNKPTTSQGGDFGRKFHVTNALTRDTYIGATVPGELYWNFGLPGIVVGLALLGMALRGMYRRYSGSAGLDPVRRAIYVMVLVQFVHMGGSLCLSIVEIVRTLVVLETLCWIGRRNGLLGPIEATAPGQPA